MLTIRLNNGQDQNRLLKFRSQQIRIGFRRGADIELEPFDTDGGEIALVEEQEDVYIVEPINHAEYFKINGQPIINAMVCAPGTTIVCDPYSMILEADHSESDLPTDTEDKGPKAVAVDKSDNYLTLFFGPVAEYLEAEDVSEVMINGPEQIYVEQKGKLELVDAKFINEQALQAAVKNVARSVNRMFNKENPRLDARLPDGSRVHAVMPPISRLGTSVAIRRFTKERLTIEQLIGFGSITKDVADLIQVAVKLHKNIIVTGATSSGKTSILNVLSSFIDREERILLIEDASELQLQQEHVVPYETRKADERGKGEVTIRDLIMSSLRLRPDRIIIGEIRGGEALDLLQALNTGHGGSMSTIHANSPVDSLSRMETCALLSGVDMPLTALRNQVASAIEVLVQTARLSDGSRKITFVSEVMPLVEGRYAVQDLMKFYSKGLDENGKIQGVHGGCGNIPTFAEEAKLARLKMNDNWFKVPEGF